ncbi:MAG: TrmO family methyltransferase, partial [Anaerolineae bacterium]
RLIVKPYLEDVFHGVFATRTPHRPNPIGLSIVRLIKCEENILHVEDVDILDGTPLLDIKPYSSRFDRRENVRNGWQENIDEELARIRGKRGYA